MTRILGVDDNSADRSLLETILKGNGYKIQMVENGAKALQAAKKFPPDLVITDVFMPVMDGFELCRRWMAESTLRHIPIIFYSSKFSDPESEELALALGAARFLFKPLPPNALIGEIQKVLKEASPHPAPSDDDSKNGKKDVLRQHHELVIQKLEYSRAALVAERDFLRKSKEKNRLLFETMDQGVVYQTADGKIISANSAAERVLGLTFDQMQGKTSRDPRWQMIEKDGTPVSGNNHPAMIALRTGQKVGPLIRGIYHPEKDSHIWLSITAIPLFQPGETKPYQVSTVFENITERKEAEEQNAKALSMQKSLNTFMLELYKINDYDELIKTIVTQIDELLSPIATTFSEYDQDARVLRMKELKTNHGVLDLLVKFGGKKLLSTATPVSDDMYKVILADRVKITSTIYEVFGGAVSKTVSSRIDKALKIKCYFGFSYIVDDQVFGTTFIALKEEPEYFVVELMKNYSYYISISLQRVLSVQALRESKELYDQLAEQSRTIAWETDASGLYTFISPVVKDLIGYNPEEIINRMYFYDLRPKEGYEEFKVKALSMMHHKETFTNFDNILEAKDGSILWVTTNGTLLMNDDGTLRGYRGSDKDISERKRAEEAVQIERNNIQTIFDTSTVAMLVLDESTAILSANMAAIDLCGGDKSLVIHHRPGDALHCTHSYKAGCGNGPDCPLCPVRRGVEDLIAGTSGQIDRVEVSLSIMRENKEQVVWLEVSAKEILFYEKRAVYVSLVDITERKRIEEALLASEEKYRAILEQSTDGIVITDEYGTITIWNTSMEAITGLQRCITIGNPIWEVQSSLIPDELVTPELLKQLRIGIKNILESKMAWPGESREQEIKCADGTRKVVQDSTFIIKIGKSVRLGIILRDISDRKQEEEARRESEQTVRAIFESASDGILLTDAESGRFVIGNDSICRMLGYSHEEIKALSVSDLYPPADLDSVRVQFEKQARGEISLIMDIPLKRKDGSIFLADVNSAPFELDGRRHLVGIFRDITERKHLEVDLHLKNMAVSSSINAIALADFQGNLTYVNPAFLKQWGYDDDKEILGRSSLEFWELEELATEVRNALQQGKGWQGELRARRKDGSTFHVQVSASPVIDDTGTIISLMAFFVDITERKRTEIELQNSLKQTHRILDNLQDAYFQVDLTGNIVLINPTATKMYGYNKLEEMIGKPGLSLFADAKEGDRLIRTLKEEGSVNEFITKGLRKDGSTFWVSINAQFVRNEDGEIISTEDIVRDVSERIRFTEELEQQRDNLEQRLHQSVNAISKIGELRDSYTAGHQKKVTELACAIASEMGLTNEQINNLSFGGLIHDVGKFYIPSDILNKPGKISDLEYKIIQTHVEKSYNIVKEIDFPEVIPTMIYQHHERLDGSGYPQRLSGEQIIIESRILAVADVVEAISSHRPYRAALGIDAALEEILLNKGKKYDCDVVDVCVKLFREKRFDFQT